MMKTVPVYEDDYGTTRCTNCHTELYCDENGDMPDECPHCGASLDYSFYEQA